MDLAALDFLIPLNTDYLHWGYLGRFDSEISHQTNFNNPPQFFAGAFSQVKSELFVSLRASVGESTQLCRKSQSLTGLDHDL